MITPYRSLVRTTDVVTEPVTSAEAKTHCKIETSDDDTYVSALITTARQYIEDILDMALAEQVWQARYDNFPVATVPGYDPPMPFYPVSNAAFVLPRAPMSSGTVTITYRDTAGVNQTLSSASSDFQVDYRATPGRIYPNYSETWPATRGDENSVVVQWTAGYAAGAIPKTLKHAVLLLVAHWYEMRQPVVAGYSQVTSVPSTLETLLAAGGWGAFRA